MYLPILLYTIVDCVSYVDPVSSIKELKY